MNATSLYVSTCRLILQADVADQSSWTDLYRLVPYLRQSMSCTVCNNLLKEPFTPTDTSCQHHVCRKCKGGRKKLKPSCTWCKDYHKYVENCQLRILLQSYKQLCEYLIGTDIYKSLVEQAEAATAADGESAASSSLIGFVQEGAGFSDDYKSPAGLSKSAYSILPCVYTNSSTQTQGAAAGAAGSVGGPEPPAPAAPREPPAPRTSNGSSLYSVMYAGTGNKITIKRKAVEDIIKKEEVEEPVIKDSNSNQSNFKKPLYRSRTSANKRKGCRCGNATATPGKLTCCGQRCPCYVDSKACSECKCKGCRNPHRADGLKVRPHIPQLENLQLSLPIKQELSIIKEEHSPSPSGSMDSLDADSLELSAMEQALTFDADIKPNVNVYTSQLQEITASLPAAIMMDEDICAESPPSEDGSGSPSPPCAPSLPPLPPLPSCLSHQDNMSDIEIDL